MSPRPFRVPDEASADRADKLLAARFPEVSRAFVRRAIEAGKVTRADGSPLEPKSKLAPGDELLVDLSAEPVPALRPVAIPLAILYEDEDLVVVDKAAGRVVHPGDGTGEDTLVHALLHHCGADGLSPVGAPDRPGIVHRLDKETSGVIVAAKTEAAHHDLASQFAERETGKEYLALVTGVPASTSGTVNVPIGRHPTVRVKMTALEKGKPARTDWEVTETFGDAAALLRCRIHTGRTHQIRVHLAFLGHPIAGDATYGYKPARSSAPPAPRVLLHARSLTFNHPKTKKSLTCEAPLPQDFQDHLKTLREKERPQPQK